MQPRIHVSVYIHLCLFSLIDRPTDKIFIENIDAQWSNRSAQKGITNRINSSLETNIANILHVCLLYPDQTTNTQDIYKIDQRNLRLERISPGLYHNSSRENHVSLTPFLMDGRKNIL